MVLYEPGGDRADAYQERPGAPIEPRRLLRAMRRAGRVLAASTVISLLAGIAALKVGILSDYAASIALQWDHEKDPAEDEARELATVLDELKLPDNIESARTRLGLTEPASSLARRVSVTSSGDSNMVTLTVVAGSEAASVGLASAIATAFLEHRIATARQRAEAQAHAIAANVALAREEVTAARKAYQDLLAQGGVVDLDAETKAAVDQAAKLREEAQLAGAESDAETARADSLGAVVRAERRTTVLSETEVVPDARRLSEANAELTELRAQLAPDHPRVRALEAQVGALSARVAGGARGETSERIVGRNPQWDAAQQGLRAAAAQRDAARERGKALRAQADEAQAALTRLAGLEAEASKLRPRTKAAEDHLAELEVQLARAEDGTRAPSSGFRVAAPAAASPGPASSRRVLLVIAAPLTGLVLAALVVALREIRGLRVLSAGEAAYWSRAPVVAASTWPREPGGLRDLIADLSACSRRARGRTLLFGLGAREARHAVVLASRLDPAGARAGASSLELPAAELRRVARAASRVIVIAESGRHDAISLSRLHVRLGRDEGVGLVLLGLEADFADLPDRVGDASAVWSNPASGDDAVVSPCDEAGRTVSRGEPVA